MLRALRISFLCGILIIILGCASSPSGSDRHSVAIFPQGSTATVGVSLNPYTAVHSLYSGLILPLELVDTINLDTKYKLIKSVWAISGKKNPVVRTELSGYFKDGPLLILPTYRHKEPQRLEWRSNAIYSPITKSPLRKKGKFLPPEDGSMRNIQDTIFLIEKRAVRLSELYSQQREERLKKEGATLHLVQLYMHDGQKENDHRIIPLLESRRGSALKDAVSKFVLDLSYVQYNLYTGHYKEAELLLKQIRSKLTTVPPALQRLYFFTYEEYCLTRAFDVQDTTYLVEYMQFL